MPDNSKTDEEIAAGVKRGDTESFSLLVERYEAKITRYGRKFISDAEDIKDLVQDIFIKAYVNIQSFDADRKFSPWIYQIAHNEFINLLKKKIKSPIIFFGFDIIFPHPAAPENPIDELEKKNLKPILDKCLTELRPKYREVLVLYFFEDLSYKEISEILKIPSATVGVRLRRGKIQLKKIFEKTRQYESKN
ncbi:MAG: RNA polymerase sigma factor [Candidatus Sungbacteria bacterium]|uniref:RNA polymerase sigma factor n=1 Tax=Candidatus Sungiibacteriota bacterium TaxID=2750080 RepID=A0A9D6DQS9_9BACT|nr:RNA polymerase sigma factor [Candidatus Sungbacteria bacterium]